MDIEESVLLIECPKCHNKIVINKTWYPGGCNDYGSFELECNCCKEHFWHRIGRDVDASYVEAGAVLLNKKYE